MKQVYSVALDSNGGGGLLKTTADSESAEAEKELIASAKNGNNEAFECLVQSYKRIVDFHIRHIDSTPSNYDDLFQEGLLGLLKAVRSYDGKSAAFSTYASLCVRSSIISGVRKYANQVSKTVPLPDNAIEDETAPSAEEVHLDDVRAKLLYDKVYSSLSPYEKIVFEMHLSDIPYESISFVTGKSVKSISNAVFRIRSKLKDIIGNADDI